MNEPAPRLQVLPIPIAPSPTGAAVASSARHLPRLPRSIASGPLRCPHCKERTARPIGNRLYQCFNAACPGGTDEIGRFLSVLIVDAARGARLLPWRTGRDISEQRAKDPLAALRRRD